jgi:hypothetical protein
MRKGRHKSLSNRVVRIVGQQRADSANPFGLLGVPGERPCRRPAEDGDEPAASDPHVLSPAQVRHFDEIATPRQSGALQ